MDKSCVFISTVFNQFNNLYLTQNLKYQILIKLNAMPLFTNNL